MKILVIDNYDSFTYNLVQYLGELGADVAVCRNDAIKVDEIKNLGISAIVISPGPSTPADAGITVDTIKRYAGIYPLLGVCLGHQSIGYAFGANIVKAGRIYHGKTSKIKHDSSGLFAGLENPLTATRYHSLVIDRKTMPAGFTDEFIITAESQEDGEIMGIRHKRFIIEGVQFHPESILTLNGKQILANFLTMVKR